MLTLLLWATSACGQQTADIRKLHKTPTEAAEYVTDIDHLTKLLATSFLSRANKPGDRINRRIQSFFEDFRIVTENKENHVYPKRLTRSNLTISVIDYDYTWGLPPSPGNMDQFEGYRIKRCKAIVAIPALDAYRRGKSLHSVSFVCDLVEEITWTEKRGDAIASEEQPCYNTTVTLSAKYLELDP